MCKYVNDFLSYDGKAILIKEGCNSMISLLDLPMVLYVYEIIWNYLHALNQLSGKSQFEASCK